MSGVGGLRWFSGVEAVDVRDNSKGGAPLVWVNLSLDVRARFSAEFEGGVGGRPESRPFVRTGYSKGDLGKSAGSGESSSSSKALGLTGNPFVMV